MANKEIQEALNFMWNNSGKYSCPVCEDNEICMTGCTNCDMAKNLIILQQAIDDWYYIEKQLHKTCDDLELYKKAFEIMTDNKHTFFVCKGRGPANNEIVGDAILDQAREELKNGK